MNQPSDYIAVFDSGVGGISVLRQLMIQMPRERYLYFGDSANAPYGTKSPQQVRELALDVARKLYDRGIKALVIACNTATAAAVSSLREAFPELIVVGIEPAVKVAADSFPGGDVGVLATPVTLTEAKFDALARRCETVCRVHRLPAPGLADLVEAGLGESDQAKALLEPILAPWKGKLNALVLGCTHYPFARNTIARILGPETVLLDGAEGTARQTCRLLQQKGLLCEGPGELVIQNSDPDPRLPALCRKLLQLQEV